MSPTGPRIVDLVDLPAGLGGGKADGLARLSRLDMAVPPALVVLDSRPGSIPENISTLWKSKGGGPAAVRSSAAGEDGEEFSAAGQYDTYLDVSADELPEAVDKCLRSRDTDTVRTYDDAMDSHADGDMAVVIQKMIRPHRAGVLFTADPVVGDTRRVVIESVAGLGEKLVSGHAEAARYVIDTISGALLESDGDLEGSGLDEELRKELTEGALKAATAWGIPLDMEWAVEDRKVYWLQARPITALADSLDTPVGSDELVTRCNIGEMMPGAATPLTLSLFGRSLHTGLAMYYRSFGALKRRETPPEFINWFDNQLFMNLSGMYLMARRVGGTSREALELSILGYVLPEHDIGPNDPAVLRAIRGFRYFVSLMNWKRKLRALQRIARRFHIQTEGRSSAELYADLYDAHGRVLDRTIALHYGVSAFSGAINAIMAAILSGGRDITAEANSLVTELMTDIPGIESAAVLEGLTALAVCLQESGAAAEVLDRAPRPAHEWLLSPESGEPGALYRVFLQRHGHRCIREAEFREPEWARNPEDLIASLQAILQAPEKPGRNTDGEPRPLPPLPEGVNPRAVKWILGKAKTGVRAREKSKSLMILIMHQFKLGFRGLGEKMADEGLLPDADLVYFLTLDELGLLLDGEGDGFVAMAKRRRRRLPEWMTLRFPDVSRGRPRPEEPPIPDSADVIEGVAVSRGVVEGPARVVTDRSDAEKLVPGEIMVALFTDIGWSPYYSRISGLVTEIGGALSHGAVVAREYGLPLVSGITGITRALKTGMRIRVDGGQGTVTIMDAEKESERETTEEAV